jgi:hypothetical protein
MSNWTSDELVDCAVSYHIKMKASSSNSKITLISLYQKILKRITLISLYQKNLKKNYTYKLYRV